jgi:hypothetical protein
MDGFFAEPRRVKESKLDKEKKASENLDIREAAPRRELLQSFTEEVETERPVREERVRNDGAVHLGRGERKIYPERKFDKLTAKMARLDSGDIDVLKAFCSEISQAKKEIPQELRATSRITDNNVIRLLVTIFCEKLEDQSSSIDYRGLQDDHALKGFIEETLGF